MTDSITVTPDELAAAFAVWIKTLPASVWREVEKQQLLDKAKRSGPERYDAREVLAQHLADKFVQCRWIATYPVPRHSDGGVELRPYQPTAPENHPERMQTRLRHDNY